MLVHSHLFLHNTLTKRKEMFKPRQEGRVKLFTCGPSTYRRPHLGNYRTFLYEDVLQRYLEYLGYAVERVINFTDVEDKAVLEAKEEGTSLRELTRPVEERFYQEAETLRIKLPPSIPKASTSVDQAVHLIQELLAKGFAYWHEGDVFFDPLQFEGFGKLFGLDMSRWPQRRVRFRKDTYNGLRWNMGDFILWHGKSDQPKDAIWDTAIGPGRPAWNVQDPAMITQTLGEAIDISCGGVDNLYRHHDYNIAVIESVSGREFARFWLHGEHLLVNAKKMSKSKGNITYPEDLLDGAMQPGELRFFLLSEHYRRRLDLNEENLARARRELRSVQRTVHDLLEASPREGTSQPGMSENISALQEAFTANMNDDLQVKRAFDAVALQLERLAALQRDQGMGSADQMELRQRLQAMDSVFGFLF
jgi:cysteinyl-tRNA synthetase